jgi:hypothetical protein
MTPLFDSNTSSPRLEIIKKYIDSNKNIFLSGIGGTGKSYLVKEIYNFYKNLDVKIALTSTTGISAYNIGGQTIHKWAELILPSTDVKDPATFIRKCLRRINNDRKLLQRWTQTKIVIIDEISMCGGTYLHFLNIIAKEIRQNNKPFGGIQLITTGDMLQLPPVKDIFPFEAPVWKELNFTNIVLTKAYRFENQDWTDTLQRIRLQKMTLSDINLLKECLQRYNLIYSDVSNSSEPEPGSLIEKITHFTISTRAGTRGPEGDFKKIKPTIISPLNEFVDRINLEELNKISGQEWIYKSIDTCGFVNSEIDEIDYSKFKKCNKEEIEFLDKETIIPSEIKLKIGSQVMLLINLDVDLGLVNGTRGIVQGCLDKSVIILFENQDTPLKVEFQKCHNVEDFEGKIYSRTMIPIKLSFAITIHKSQGSTLTSAIVNCGRGIFSEGQAYVALSRVRNSDNLYLSEFFPSKITTNKKALTFEQNMLKNCIFIDAQTEFEPFLKPLRLEPEQYPEGNYSLVPKQLHQLK